MSIREWLKEQIDIACATQMTRERKVKDEAGNETVETVPTKRREFDFGKFIDISAENGVPAERVAEAREWLGVKNGPGRVRMTLGNQLYTLVAKAGHLVVGGVQIALPEALVAERKAQLEAVAEAKKARLDAAKAEAQAAAAAAEQTEGSTNTEEGETSAEPETSVA